MPEVICHHWVDSLRSKTTKVVHICSHVHPPKHWNSWLRVACCTRPSATAYTTMSKSTSHNTYQQQITRHRKTCPTASTVNRGSLSANCTPTHLNWHSSNIYIYPHLLSQHFEVCFAGPGNTKSTDLVLTTPTTITAIICSHTCTHQVYISIEHAATI